MASEQLNVRLLLQAQQYKTEARQAASATGQIGTSAQATGTATGNLQKKMGGLGATAKFAVGGVAAGAVAKFGKDSVQAFLGFDDAMNQSLAIMGDVSDELRGDMADAAREIGRTTRIGADEAAEAYFFLASAGLDAEQSISALPQVAQFAQAGMFDMATATDLATDAQSALGLTVDDAQENLENLTRVTDVFVRANTLANTSVEQVAAAMTNRAGAAMRALGIDIEEGTAVLAAFADQGVKGETAGQQLAIVLRDLQTRAIENKEAFEKAGISVFDSQGEFRNFADVIGDLEGRLEGMSDEQKKAELSMLGFSDRSIAALTTLLGTSEAIREYEGELRKAGGTTEEVADNQLDSFQGQLELLKGRVEDAQIALGEGLVPALVNAADAAMPLIDLVGKLGSGLTAVQDSSNALKQADDPFSKIVGTLASPQGALSTFLQSMEMLNEEFGSSEDATREAASGFSVLGGEMDQIPSTDVADAFSDAGEAARNLDPDLRRLFGSAGDVADAQEDVERETSNATTALEEQFDLLRSQLDPLFALEESARRVAEGQAEVSRLQAEGKTDTEEYEQAVLDLFEANVDLRGAQTDVVGASDSTREAFIEQAEELGATREEAELLADIFGDLEGFEFTPKEISISTRVSGPGSRTVGSLLGSADVVERQHGGPLRARQPAIVGEAGPELFIPEQAGHIVPNPGVSEMSGGGTGSRTVVNVGTVYGWDDFVEKVNQAGVQIERFGWS